MDFILGGYFLVKLAKRSGYMDADLVPNTIYSVSNCICDVIPGIWALDWVQQRDESIKRIKSSLNLDTDDFKKIETWVTTNFNNNKTGWQNGFFDKETAIEFYQTFLKDKQDIVLLGIGLGSEDLDLFFDEEKPQKGMGSYLVYDVLKFKTKLSPSNCIGYDILGFDCGQFHSYLCNGLQKDFNKKFDMKPNQYGFFDKYELAKVAADYVLDEGTGAEPALWQAWMVCKYDLN